MKQRIIRTIAQWFADGIINALKTTTDPNMQRILVEQGAMLDAYCIVFHDIYLD
jgi:hypothetical protein